MKNSKDFLNFIEQQVKTVLYLEFVLKTFGVRHQHDYKTDKFVLAIISII